MWQWNIHIGSDFSEAFHFHVNETHFPHVPWSKAAIFGMVIPPLLGNPYNGYINPYHWVDEFIPYYMEIMGVDRPWHAHIRMKLLFLHCHAEKGRHDFHPLKKNITNQQLGVQRPCSIPWIQDSD